MAASLWTATAAPTELSVSCAGARHRLEWRDGEVHLHDHPDRDAELALVGLGGAEPNCIAHLRLFEDAVRDGGFLAGWADDSGLTQAWYSWLDAALERMRTEGFHEVLRDLPQSRSMRQGEFISRFPLAWLDRAAATIADGLWGMSTETGVVCADAEPNLIHAIRVRARRAFVQSVGVRHLTVGGAALVPLRINIVTEGVAAVEGHLTGSDRQVTLTVDRTWLHQVWAAGAATIEDRLILALTPPESAAGEPAPVYPHFDGTDSFEALATWVDWPQTSGDATLHQDRVHHDGGQWVMRR